VITHSDDLESLVTEMKQRIASGNEEGVADLAEAAFPLSIDVVLEKSRGNFEGAGPYDLEILTLGHSPQPLVHSILAVQPKRALLLYTCETQTHVEFVRDRLGDREVQVQIDQARISAVDPCDVYRAVFEAAQADDVRRIAVDATGGKKAMVMGATLAAGFIRADLVYVDSEYFRRPEDAPAGPSWVIPGSERVIRLASPYEYFGHLKARRATDLIAQHRYAAAEVLRELADRDEPAMRRYRIEYSLAAGYAAAEDLCFTDAKTGLRRAAEGIRSALREGADIAPATEEEAKVLDRQADYAEALSAALDPDSEANPLADEAVFPLWSFLYNYALRRAEVGQYDMASLALYRCLELIPRRRRGAAYGLWADTISREQYAALAEKCQLRDWDGLKAAYRRWQLTDGNDASAPPGRPNLVNSVRLLFATEDDAVKEIGDGEARQHLLDGTYAAVQARNASIWAHGFKQIEQAQYTRFLCVVETWAQAMCAAEGWDWEELQTAFRFITMPWG